MPAASRSRSQLTSLVPRSTTATEPAVRPRPRWTTTRVNVWRGPGEDSKLITVLDTGAKLHVTGTIHGRWAEIAWKGRTAWVRKAYLARSKPTVITPAAGVAAVAGVSGKPCPDGSAVESGLQPNTVRLYRAVCAAFPAVSASLRDSIAIWVRAHASQFGVSYVINAQHIWSVQRSSEGWRAMEDRGSTTANHYDHVHVSLY
jgi:SH3-like domain-containing protein